MDRRLDSATSKKADFKISKARKLKRHPYDSIKPSADSDDLLGETDAWMV